MLFYSRLKFKGDQSAFDIPPVGRPYQQQWSEEDALLYDGIYQPTAQTRGEFVETDDTVLPGDVTLGPLTERLLSCLIPEGIVPDQRLLDEDAEIPAQKHKPRTSADMAKVEERVKKELIFLGLYSEQQVRMRQLLIANRTLPEIQAMKYLPSSESFRLNY